MICQVKVIGYHLLTIIRLKDVSNNKVDFGSWCKVRLSLNTFTVIMPPASYTFKLINKYLVNQLPFTVDFIPIICLNSQINYNWTKPDLDIYVSLGFL